MLGQAGYSITPPGTAYRLRPADTISVLVFREEGLSREQVVVPADGAISLPLVGTVAVAGKTLAEVETEVERALGARYLRNPEVAVNVVNYGSHQVTVDGAVETPGLYAFQPGTRLSGAVSMAEGPTRVAQLQQVAVFRYTPEGMMVAKFDYGAIRAGNMVDPVLQPGDRIVVGTDGLSQLWQDLLTALPAFALFTRL